MAEDWFVKIEGKEKGPLNGQQLRTAVAKGKVLPEYLIRRGTDGPWVPAGRVKGLFPAQAAGDPAKPAKAKVAKPAAKTPPLAAAQAAPQPPASDIPAELTLGSHGHKKHVSMNVDKLNISTQPVKVAGRKTRGVAGLKKEEQKKLNMILLGVIGVGMTIVILAFGIALATGKFSSPPEEAKKEETKVEEKPKEKPKPEVKKEANDEAWNQAGTADTIKRGDVEIKVLKPVWEAPPETLKDLCGDYPQTLVVPVKLNLWKDDAEEPVKLTNWGDDSLKERVVLKDDNDEKPGKTTHYKFFGAEVKDKAKSIVPGKSVHVRLVFIPRTKTPNLLHLELPTEAFGVKGKPMRFEVAKKNIPERPEVKDDDDSDSKETKKKPSAKESDEEAAPAAKAKKKKKSADDEGN
jgi:hypothetical protein